jgi:hypothetical protein
MSIREHRTVKCRAEKHHCDAVGHAIEWRFQTREGRLPPLPIELEKNPATLKSRFSFWAVVRSIGIAGRIGNRLEGSF